MGHSSEGDPHAHFSFPAPFLGRASLSPLARANLPGTDSLLPNKRKPYRHSIYLYSTRGDPLSPLSTPFLSSYSRVFPFPSGVVTGDLQCPFL
ncbi:hypothetical protein PHAVU_002G096300 [Phaseolus vulgaris]|uniref:Uncharacterized protein n=1 Tax=Phaseolus vulgaris TaxID=3885 RepID=V7CK81_PHAVU|nr:hypothetical protein PHAVU_002G096300g [Phaseolus vulgaris]ESW29753.1 hypothetical protein PHAVU_002G096300g [Phaseolus vulgaris]